MNRATSLSSERSVERALRWDGILPQADDPAAIRALSERVARSREERDPALARTYLTSETGKVYTMLAHASGRFD